MARGKTRTQFMDMMEQDDSCYVYYLDDKKQMHFVSDNPHGGSDTEGFCRSLAGAMLMSERTARMAVTLFDAFFTGREHHIVKIHTNVEWL